MGIYNLSNKYYNSIQKRLRVWGLPFLLLVAYISGFELVRDNQFQILTRIQLSFLHSLGGILVSLLWISLTYDLVLKIIRKEKKIVMQNGTRKLVLIPSSIYTKRDWVDFLFYFVLFILCLVGVLLYLSRWGGIVFFDSHVIAILHQFIGWTFISLILVKYYLSFTLWFKNLVRYLREY
ncbi:MAG: hypothetical protein OEY59_00560 [Deltaproteobacteria bacterium]|nr:hypothetical protein [Deltaproteobacteria bacterium]